jgi:hypothetical protein
MSGPYVRAYCDDCDQYVEKFCDDCGLCIDCGDCEGEV